ncbi:MAG: LytTR family DNA-binding domain-containing protein [Bacteroidota bacterium]
MNYNIILAEDIPATRREIKSLLEEHDQFHVLEDVESVDQTIAAFHKYDQIVDALVLDITLMNGTAFDILKQLRSDNVDIPPVIIITGNTRPEYQKQLVEFREIVGYIHKPILDKWNESIANCLTSISSFYAKQLQQNSDMTLDSHHANRLLAESDKKIIPIEFKDIVYMKSCPDTGGTLIYATSQKGMVCDTRPSSQIEKLLPPQVFYRINRQYIINAKKISEFNKGEREVSLQNGEVIQFPVAFRRTSGLMDAMKW